jgi:3-hydroxyisobutyrate dehydrogenase
MIGGDKDVVEALQPCWEAMGKTIVHPGRPGRRQHTKMVNQILIATNMIGVCEALLYAYKAGLDLETVMQSVGVRRGRQLVAVEPRPADHRQQLRPRLLRRALHQGHGDRPGRSQAHGPGAARPGAGHQLYIAVQAQGHGRDGTHALQLAAEATSNRTRSESPSASAERRAASIEPSW